MRSQPGRYTEKSEIWGPKTAGPSAKHGLKGGCWGTLATNNLPYVSDVQLANQDLTLKGIPMKLNHVVDKKRASPPSSPVDFVASMLSSA